MLSHPYFRPSEESQLCIKNFDNFHSVGIKKCMHIMRKTLKTIPKATKTLRQVLCGAGWDVMQMYLRKSMVIASRKWGLETASLKSLFKDL